jgi:phage recombination protein Bet
MLPQTQIGDAEIKTLAAAGIIPHDTPPAILQVFALACNQHGLSPFKKEIYLVPYNTASGKQYHTIVGIDGLRRKAARTGEYAGCDEAVYNRKSDGTYKTAAEVKGIPATCTVTVYRLLGGQRCPFTKTVVFSEYYPAVSAGKGSGKAASMPFNMIAKCAEAGALRMAFADEMAGLHIEEESAAIEDRTVSAAQIRPSVAVDVEALADKIADCWDNDALRLLYNSNPAYAEYAEMFTARKDEISALRENGQVA